MFMHLFLKHQLCVSCSNLCYLFLQSLAKKLDDGIRVPLIYAQRLHNVSLVIHQLDEWVRTTHVPHFQAGKSVWIISLHKGLDLWVPPQFSSTYFQLCKRVYLGLRCVSILLATLITWLYQWLKTELFQFSA